jgi:hypothetical protein
MSKGNYDLDIIIENSFREVRKFLHKNGIEIEGLELIILESESDKNKYRSEVYKLETRKIYIAKNTLKEIINEVINNSNKIFIGNLVAIQHNAILWPLYIPVYIKDNDIEKAIVKAIVDLKISHEIAYYIVGGSWKASFLASLIYFYKNKLYNYPGVYEIMEKNIEICEKNKKILWSYALGSCFANDIIYVYENALNRNNELPRLNIRDIIEKIKFFSKDYYVEITKTFNMILSDYIAISKTLNAKYAMLSWITNCLLEKLPNMTNNI